MASFDGKGCHHHGGRAGNWAGDGVGVRQGGGDGRRCGREPRCGRGDRGGSGASRRVEGLMLEADVSDSSDCRRVLDDYRRAVRRCGHPVQ